MRTPFAFLLAPPAVLAAITLASCGGTTHDAAPSVNAAATAMEDILSTYPDRIAFHHELEHWGFTTPSLDKAEWTVDSSLGSADVAFVLQAQPLIDVGIDPATFSSAGWTYLPPSSSSAALLIRTWDVSSAAPMQGHIASAAATFRTLLEQSPSRITYHGELQHYGIDLGNGDKFEWTRDLAANDADLAFVLGADAFVAAGVDLAKLQQAGWSVVPAAHNAPAVIVKPVRLD